MKNRIIYLNLQIIFLLSIISVACSISNEVNNGKQMQKRKYNKGWHVKPLSKSHKNDEIVQQGENKIEVKKKNNESIEKISSNIVNNKLIDEQKNQTISASIENMIPETAPINKSFFNKHENSLTKHLLNQNSKQENTVKHENCDVIIFKNGNEDNVKISEIGLNEIKYKKCNTLSDNTVIYTVSKSSVFKIRFSDGTDLDISTSRINAATGIYNTHHIYGKSQIAAALLCFFIGVIGIHRFYLGYIGIGIIQLLTFGFCGIWTLVDFIRILIGDLKPKYSDYTQKF